MKKILFVLNIMLCSVLAFLVLMPNVSEDKAEPKAGNLRLSAKDYAMINNPAKICKFSPNALFATIQPTANGLWTDTKIWPGGQLPTANDDVIIPSGRILTMVGTCRAKSIAVNGTLNAVNWQAGGAWINLETENIIVQSGGKLEIGTEAQPYYATDKCIITLTGNKIANAPASSKAILVMQGGTFELHGKKRKSWTNIATTANAGATTITLKDAVDWEIGDVIALTSTELANEQTKSWERVDQVEILNISADKKTITLKTPLLYKHIGGSKTYTRAADGKTWTTNIQAEVGLLTHYIKIQGKMDGTNEADGFGGHMMFMKGSTVHAEQVELYKMGQKAIIGRYPFHWHLCEDAAKGSYFRNSSVHKSFNRAVTIHGTDYVTVDGIYAYDHIGHGIFFEDGGERYNTVKNNVVFVSRRPKAGEQLTPSDNEQNAPQNRTPSSYWITNPNNYFENNVAAGTEGTGFWIALPVAPLLESSGLPYFQGLVPKSQPLGKFDGFVVHTCMNGWDLFDQLNPNHSLNANWGWEVTTNQYIQNGLFYGNDQALYCGLAVNSDPEKIVFRNCAFTDNKMITMLAADLKIENCLFNVDTDFGVFAGERNFYRYYDGPGIHVNCHFEGWDRSYSNFILPDIGGGATINLNPIFSGITKGFANPIPIKYANVPAGERPAKVSLLFKDLDGSLSGKAKTTVVRDIPFFRDGHEYRHSSWVRAIRSDYSFASVWLNHMMLTNSPVAVVRSKPGTSNVCMYDAGGSNQTYKYPLIANQNFLYTFHFTKLPSNNNIHFILDYGVEGDLVTTCYKGLGKLANFRISGHRFTLPLVNSVNAVLTATSHAYFIDANGDVYLRSKANDRKIRLDIFFNWDGMGTYAPTPLPCSTNDYTPITTSLSTDEFAENSEMVVYPNPAIDGIFYLNEEKNFEVYDAQGRIIEKKKSSKIIDLSGKSKGIYFLIADNIKVKLIR